MSQSRHVFDLQPSTCGKIQKRIGPPTRGVRVLMDPFEVRMQFLSLIRKLNASVLFYSRSTLT
jgi:hypothetical protein